MGSAEQWKLHQLWEGGIVGPSWWELYAKLAGSNKGPEASLLAAGDQDG